jgi:RNA polymerase sigma factor (sigma-70 family)
MPASKMSKVIHQLRSAAMRWEVVELTDGQLLESFINRRDQMAVEGIVRRHGPMVWRVCRRILHNYHDAEDAFQATFVVLVRKATSIMPREMLANWLYGVAHQTALKARATTEKRRTRERQQVEMPDTAVAEKDHWSDLQPLLDQELSLLPDKYRIVIVLCELEGKTRPEVARQIGVPEGTVASRLARARSMLAKRLTRRGLGASGGMLAALLAHQAASAGIPASVAFTTIEAASLLAAGQAAATGAISVKVAALSEGVLKSMLLTKLKMMIAMVLLVGAALTCIAGLTYQTHAAEQQDTANSTERVDKEKQPVAKEGQKSKPDNERLQEVQIRIVAPIGMKVCLSPHSDKNNKVVSIEVPGRLNLEQGKRSRLKLYDISNRPGIERFPIVEILPMGAVTRPFLANSAIPIEFTDEDFDHVNGGRAITKVAYLTNKSKGSGTKPPKATDGSFVKTIASYDFVDQDVIELARQRGTVLAIVRMGNIDLGKDDKLAKIVIGDDGIQGRVQRLDKGTAKAKPNDNRAEKLADQLEHIMRDVATVQAENQELRQQLKDAQLELRSLRTLLERKERELKKAK